MFKVTQHTGFQKTRKTIPCLLSQMAPLHSYFITKAGYSSYQQLEHRRRYLYPYPPKVSLRAPKQLDWAVRSEPRTAGTSILT